MSDPIAPEREKHRAGGTGAHRHRRILEVILLLLVLWLAWLGFNSARTALALKLLEADVRLLETRPELVEDPQRMQDLFRATTHASALAGNQVEALELIARVHWLGASVAATPKAQIVELRLARDALHAALARRSSWPYTWALLARVEFNLAPRGKEALVALNQALDLGMRGYALQRELLELRLLSEGRVDASVQSKIRDSFLQGVREHGARLAELAMNLGRLDWACADLDVRVEVLSWCESMERVIGQPRR